MLKLNCDKALAHLRWTAVLDYKTLIDFTGEWYYRFYREKADMFAFTIAQITAYEEQAKAEKQIWAT